MHFVPAFRIDGHPERTHEAHINVHFLPRREPGNLLVLAIRLQKQRETTDVLPQHRSHAELELIPADALPPRDRHARMPSNHPNGLHER